MFFVQGQQLFSVTVRKTCLAQLLPVLIIFRKNRFDITLCARGRNKSLFLIKSDAVPFAAFPYRIESFDFESIARGDLAQLFG